MLYNVGQEVFTSNGKGVVVDSKAVPYDGNCYQIQLEDGTLIWRKENYVASVDDQASKIALEIAKKFNLNLASVKKVIDNIK
jgi:hypothetical protein